MERKRGVLLDIDGTLADSNDAHARAWQAALAEHHYHVDIGRVRSWIGMGGDKLLPAATGLDSESALGRAIAKRRGEIFRERYLQHVVAFPRSRDLLMRMKRDGLKLVAASSASEEELGPLLQRCGVRDLLHAETSSGDAENSKPDPDILHAALARAQLEPDDACMLGDTPYDVQAAKRAGVPIVALRCGGWRDADLVGAVAIYDDPARLLIEYEDSPFAQLARGASIGGPS
jgi:phosphoglycolate phosphatase-like HAD superfamily hydrolase